MFDDASPLDITSNLCKVNSLPWHASVEYIDLSSCHGDVQLLLCSSLLHSSAQMATIRGTITLFLALCCLCNLTSARVHLARRVSQRLDARSSSAGGWVLVNPTCPSGSTACPSVLESNAATCCPNSMTCQYDINLDQHYCCPSGMSLSQSTPLRRDRETNNVIAGSNCQSTIQAVPVCANPSWDLYSQSSLLGGFFCCLPSQVGILSDGEHIGSCNDAGVAYPSSILASSVSRSTSLPTVIYEAMNC
jgi:hypothetical protein